MSKETRDPIRFWGAIGGAAALVVAIAVGIVMHVRTSKTETAAAARPAVKTQAAIRPSPARPQPPAVKLTDAERKTSEALWAEQKKLESDAARVTGALPDGRKRVAAIMAKYFDVPETLVNDLRGRRVSYGDMTVALALSQQLMKRDKVTQQKALDRIFGLRNAGHGWAATAHVLGLKLDDAMKPVQKVDRQVAKIDIGKAKS